MTSPKRLAATGGAAPGVYIEDVFSTNLWTGTGSAQTITNGIDLSTKGGLVWTKARSNAFNHALFDTARGTNIYNSSNTINANTTSATSSLTTFNTTGFNIGSDSIVSNTGSTFVGWTFRKQAKFFDVVTYTGDGSSRAIPHNLGSVPGCIIVKRLDATGNWQVYHKDIVPNNAAFTIQLNLTNAQSAVSAVWNSTAPTSTQFTVGTDATVNATGGTYVAYLFAHNAGGFGASGNDNVISCGQYLGNTSSAPVIDLGFEPQWVLIKSKSLAGTSWGIYDVMRGFSNVDVSNNSYLMANVSDAEINQTDIVPFATGFFINRNTTSNNVNADAASYVYIAIRRGPMKTPTSGTSVFGLSARTGTGANVIVAGGQIADLAIVKNRGATGLPLWASRMTGTGYVDGSATTAETAAGTTILQANPWDVMDGVKLGTTSTITNASSNTFINYLFRRAPGFMDVVCYTGDDAAGRTVKHNLGAKPLINFIKRRDAVSSWTIYTDLIDGSLDFLQFDNTAKQDSAQSVPTSTVFSVSNGGNVNAGNSPYIARMFGNVGGVSKCGVYTGTGAAQTIDCGFSAGARFVMIKRTDSTGDWYVWDTARGIISGNDPYFLMNSTAAQVTNTDYLSVQSSGFGLTASAPAALNANGGTYLYLAIA